MTEPQSPKGIRVGELFVEITGKTTIEENQITPQRRVVEGQDEQPVGELSRYITQTAKAHGLEDAIGDSADDGSG